LHNNQSILPAANETNCKKKYSLEYYFIIQQNVVRSLKSRWTLPILQPIKLLFHNRLQTFNVLLFKHFHTAIVAGVAEFDHLKTGERRWLTNESTFLASYFVVNLCQKLKKNITYNHGNDQGQTGKIKVEGNE
jgi:hypothetical protein